MTLLIFLNTVLSVLVIGGQVFVVLSLVYLVFLRKKYPAIGMLLGKYGMAGAFFVALASVLGSLFYSQIAGFMPCELCWFQRIFLYPQVLLLALALIKKDSGIVDYALSLSLVGGLVSLYHNYMYYYNGGLNVFCQLSGIQVSCVKRYVFEFGYITIPMMALTAFVLIIIFLLFKKYKNNI